MKEIKTIPGFIRVESVNGSNEWLNVAAIIKFTLAERGGSVLSLTSVNNIRVVIHTPDEISEAIREASKRTVYTPSGY